jgi:hypothetical protein
MVFITKSQISEKLSRARIAADAERRRLIAEV